MTAKLADLQKLRAALVERRREESHSLTSEHDEERIKMVGHLHLAIEALEAVIQSEPADVNAMLAND
jgi:hypothetical protein